ncbi:DNA-processing protein DprA [Desulfococcus multivorans]|uniref:DNA protecting protein DprA n=1 Tax=Desulfococcus multivorans DSM 2059 TaxID=1121405 RepID=S7VK36_DESML|nr:DNA-processing protein DprA [Desulfococcus multivorans]AQV03017.2 DNA protecting protein DprA [Desulfococcus multivorans]EPR44928.1 DNA protecting protein DprA [Desulfococcus multivorans DSM 2059]SJZ83660.1 DNA protecting protein DprA [Desulfococcus multivorans DSM 2059]
MAESRRETIGAKGSKTLDPLASESLNSLTAWFRLRSVPGVGNYLFKRLVDRFGSPDEVFQAAIEVLQSVDGVSRRLAVAIKAHPLTEAVKKELALLKRSAYSIITMNDPDYPGLLLEIPDPPPFLYVYGDLGDGMHNIAVVGSRSATAYGRATARKLCSEIASAGFTVVSGLALGIDTAAHEGALAAGGKTIAVLGTGLDQVYPAANRHLCHQIARSGAVITEFPLKAGPDAHHFPVRNRIISGISLGTVVVEAARKSGSLITARLAAEQNREVFAVPGSVHSTKSVGTHFLIKQGAKLVETVDDIFEEFPTAVTHATAGSSTLGTERSQDPLLSAEERRVISALGPYPIHIDALVRSLDMDAGKLSAVLMQMELKGLVVQAPGKMFLIESDTLNSVNEKRQG